MKEELNNENGISRRGFLKVAALTGAAFAMPAGLNKVIAGEPKQAETSGKDNNVAHITGHRVLGTGAAAFEVSALGFGVMGMTYNRSQHPEKKACIRLLHEAVDRGVSPCQLPPIKRLCHICLIHEKRGNSGDWRLDRQGYSS